MGNFKIIKKGYSQLEVDEYIARLVEDYEAKLAEQKDRIFYLKDQLDKISKGNDKELMTSLVSAVERAKMIENSSKNIYELETKKISLLYNKMEKLLSSNDDKNNEMLKTELLSLIQDCRKSLQNNISMQNDNLRETTIGDPVKKLLTKMIDFNKISLAEKPKENTKIKYEIKEEDISTQKNQTVKTVQIKKVARIEEQDNNFNEFLSNQDKFNGGNFEDIMFSKNQRNNSVINNDLGDLTPNESGFDLKEAINPKEDLEEIMKAFDFFNDNKKNK